MRSVLFHLALLASFVLLFSSCKKDDPVDQTPIVVPALNVGRAATGFTASADFAGGTTFVSSNAPNSNATSTVSGTSRTMILNTRNDIGDNYRYATIIVTLPDSMNTTAGNLSANLSQPAGATILASVSIRSAIGTMPTSNYNSVSGTLGITKLTTAEIEGEFVANVNDGLTGGLVLSNGTFAGRFQ